MRMIKNNAKRAASILFALLISASVMPIPSGSPAAAQTPDSIRVVAVEAAEEPVTAWAEAYNAATGEAFDVEFLADDAAVFGAAGGADIVFVGDTSSSDMIALDCGVLSRDYAPLPDLFAQYVNWAGCGGDEPDPAGLAQFVEFVVGPDGQQIAIDLGLLPAEVEVVDQAGATVVVPQPVRGIVSGYGVATYYVYAVGAGDRLQAGAYVGVRGPAAQDVFRKIDPDFDVKFTALSVLNQREINVEEVASLGPDLVIASARTQWTDTVEELGVPVLRFEGETPERLQEAMLLTGQVLGPDALYRAQMFNEYYDATLSEIVMQTEAIDRTPSVYFSGTEPLRVASGDMYQTAMIRAAGGEPVSADLTGFWNNVNLEQVLVWDPDVIFVPTYGGATVEAFTGSDEWAVVPAVAEGEVYQLPSFISPWDTPLPDSILGIIWMAETLFPDTLDLNCAGEVTYFYNTFYDYAIPQEEVQGLCQ